MKAGAFSVLSIMASSISLYVCVHVRIGSSTTSSVVSSSLLMMPLTRYLSLELVGSMRPCAVEAMRGEGPSSGGAFQGADCDSYLEAAEPRVHDRGLLAREHGAEVGDDLGRVVVGHERRPAGANAVAPVDEHHGQDRHVPEPPQTTDGAGRTW